MSIKCVSCHENLISEENFTRFRCPQCMNVEIIRCIKCRRKSNAYTCSGCGFEGP